MSETENKYIIECSDCGKEVEMNFEGNAKLKKRIHEAKSGHHAVEVRSRTVENGN